jgi:hypothetical protein
MSSSLILALFSLLLSLGAHYIPFVLSPLTAAGGAAARIYTDTVDVEPCLTKSQLPDTRGETRETWAWSVLCDLQQLRYVYMLS